MDNKKLKWNENKNLIENKKQTENIVLFGLL